MNHSCRRPALRTITFHGMGRAEAGTGRVAGQIPKDGKDPDGWILRIGGVWAMPGVDLDAGPTGRMQGCNAFTSAAYATASRPELHERTCSEADSLFENGDHAGMNSIHLQRTYQRAHSPSAFECARPCRSQFVTS